MTVGCERELANSPSKGSRTGEGVAFKDFLTEGRLLMVRAGNCDKKKALQNASAREVRWAGQITFPGRRGYEREGEAMFSGNAEKLLTNFPASQRTPSTVGTPRGGTNQAHLEKKKGRVTESYKAASA